MKFKIKTKDTILFITRVIVLDAETKQHAEVKVKQDYPNSQIVSVTEHEEEQ